MKGFLLSILLLPVLLAIPIFTSAQQKSQKINTNELIQPVESNQYKDWQKVKLGQYSFYVPKEFKLTKKPGIDSTYWKYTSENYDFTVIEGPYAPGAGSGTNASKAKNIKYGYLSIDSVRAQTWSYEDETKSHKYVKAIAFNHPKWVVNSVAIYLESKNVEGQELAKRIFDSIKFEIPN